MVGYHCDITLPWLLKTSDSTAIRLQTSWVSSKTCIRAAKRTLIFLLLPLSDTNLLITAILFVMAAFLPLRDNFSWSKLFPSTIFPINVAIFVDSPRISNQYRNINSRKYWSVMYIKKGLIKIPYLQTLLQDRSKYTINMYSINRKIE